MAKKKNPHIRRSLDEFIGEQRAKDPEFRAEFDRLQLARKVKGLREKKKMSQVELAALAGTKQRNIARLESGKVVPSWTFSRRSRARLVDTWTSASLSGSRTRDGRPAAPRADAGTLLPSHCPRPGQIERIGVEQRRTASDRLGGDPPRDSAFRVCHRRVPWKGLVNFESLGTPTNQACVVGFS